MIIVSNCYGIRILVPSLNSLVCIIGREECLQSITLVTALVFAALLCRIRCLGQFCVVLLGEHLTHSRHLSVSDLNQHCFNISVLTNKHDLGFTVVVITRLHFVCTCSKNGTLSIAAIGINPALGCDKSAVFKKEHGFGFCAVIFLFSKLVPCSNRFFSVIFRKECLAIRSFIVFTSFQTFQFFT